MKFQFVIFISSVGKLEKKYEGKVKNKDRKNNKFHTQFMYFALLFDIKLFNNRIAIKECDTFIVILRGNDIDGQLFTVT